MTDDSSRTRRGFLRTAGATGAVGALAGCGGRGRSDRRGPAANETNGSGTSPTSLALQNADRYETVVNVVEAGGDASGEKPVDAILDDEAGDDTLIYFPSGRYRVDSWKASGYRNLGVVGEDATLVPPTGVDNWLTWTDLREFTFAGFTVDCRGEGVAPVVYLWASGGTNVVRDVTIRGHRRLPRTGFEVAATDPSADLRFENVALPDGATDGHAVYVFPESVGRLTFRNCRIEHWHEGLYASYHSGPLRVLGGYYANNGIEQVRVGGGTAGALVRGTTVRVDDPRRAQHKPNMRGIWAEEGGSVRIEDCDLAVTDLTGTYSSGAIVVGTQFGEAVVRDTRIRTDADALALSVRPPIESMEGQYMPSMERLPERTRFRAENVRVVGSAERSAAVRVNRRDDCRFENLCVHHPDGSRDGVLVSNADDCAVRNSTIDVGGEPVTTENATVATTGIRTDGSC